MTTIIYSKKACPNCDYSKMLMQSRNQPYIETVIGEDITREEFMTTFPGVMSVPYIIINGKPIGGFTELKEYYNGLESKTFLTED